MSSDVFHDYLPLLLSAGTAPDARSIHEIGRKNALRYQIEVAKANKLAQNRKIAMGSAIIMLASSDRDNLRNEAELAENLGAAEHIARTLHNIGVDNKIEIVPDYSRGDFENALADPRIGHLMLFGHSKRSGVFVPDDPILWRNTSPVDHLKRSVGVIGCGVYDRAGVTPRFGFNLVDPTSGILYGTDTGGPQEGKIQPNEMRDLGNFMQLDSRLIETPVQTTQSNVA